MNDKITFKLAALYLTLTLLPNVGYSAENTSRSFLDSLRPDLSFFGGFTFSNLGILPNYVATTQGPDHSLGIGWGYGFLAGADIKRSLGAELGLFYSQKKLGLSGINNSGNMAINVINLPVMGRWTPFSFVSLHAGAYLGLGSNSTINIDGGSSTPIGSQTDTGLIFGLTVNRPVLPTLYIVGGGFYELGMKDVSTDSSNAKIRSFDLFIGVKYKPE